VNTARALLPLAIAIAVIGVVTWYLLAEDIWFGPWVLAFLLFAHGWVHLMFVFPKPERRSETADAPPYPFDMDRSWLIARAGLDRSLVRRVGIALMAVVFVGFLLAALATVGILVPVDWWGGLVVVSALASMLLLGMFYSPSLILGFPIDLALLWLVLAAVWSPAAG
jgi:hypothetical protein